MPRLNAIVLKFRERSGNKGLTNLEQLCQFCLRGSSGVQQGQPPNVVSGHFPYHAWMRMSALSLAVIYVILFCADEKMGRVDTRGIVTLMANQLSVRNCTMNVFVHHSVCQERLPFTTNLTVSITTTKSSPKPTSIRTRRCIHTSPEPLPERALHVGRSDGESVRAAFFSSHKGESTRKES